MHLLSPWALCWLGSLPVLVWLWRFAAVKRQTRVASLVPFEALLRRPPTRRTRPPLSLLFWLQALVCALAAWALAEPVVVGRTTHTTLIVLDTSASMGAVRRGASAFDRAKRALTAHVASKPLTERVYVVTSAPVQVLTPTPLSDPGDIRAAVDSVAVSDLAGQLSVAAKVGEAVIGGPPDATVVFTDEPAPADATRSVTFRSVGGAAPNVAIVGLESDEPLCLPADAVKSTAASSTSDAAPGREGAATVRVTVQNFAPQSQPVTVEVARDRRRLARQRVTVEAGARTLVAVPLPRAGPGQYDVRLDAPHDALAVDNHAVVSLGGAGRRAVRVVTHDQEFLRAVGRWLDACPGLSWSASDAGEADDLLVTDDPAAASRASASTLLISDGSAAAVPAPPKVVYWLVDSTHLLGRYLEPIQPVPMALPPSQAPGPLSGVPVIWGIADGERIPLLLAAEEQGRRLVTLRLDPRASPDAVPIIVVFFNSVQWLARASESTTTGTPLLVGPLAPGEVRVERPDGRIILVQHPGGVLRYDRTDRAGVHRIRSAHGVIERTVNFLDPAESNTIAVGSTWDAAPTTARAAAARTPVRQPLSPWLIIVMLVLVVVEWVYYARRRRREPR